MLFLSIDTDEKEVCVVNLLTWYPNLSIKTGLYEGNTFAIATRKFTGGVPLTEERKYAHLTCCQRFCRPEAD